MQAWLALWSQMYSLLLQYVHCWHSITMPLLGLWFSFNNYASTKVTIAGPSTLYTDWCCIVWRVGWPQGQKMKTLLSPHAMLGSLNNIPALHQLLVLSQYAEILSILSCGWWYIQYATLMPNNICFLAIFAVFPKCECWVLHKFIFSDKWCSGPQLHACYAECKSQPEDEPWPCNLSSRPWDYFTSKAQVQFIHANIKGRCSNIIYKDHKATTISRSMLPLKKK